MTPFCKLADAKRYVSCDWDLSVNTPGREWWVDFFKRHFLTILGLGMDVERTQHPDLAKQRPWNDDLAARAERCRASFHARCDAFLRNPKAFGPVTIVTLDIWRDSHLRDFGFPDAFLNKKNQENEKMLPMLPEVCRRLDELSGASRPKPPSKASSPGISSTSAPKPRPRPSWTRAPISST